MNRIQLAQAVDNVGLVRLVMRARRSWSPWITVLTYHRAAGCPLGYMFDEDVVDVTAEEFDAHLTFLGKYYSFIGASDLLRFRKGAPLPANPVLVTFDDGYLDNYEVALPLLLRHKATATFFVATDFVQSRRLFWWDKINYLVKNSKPDPLRLTYPVSQTITLDADPARRNDAIRRMLSIVKRWNNLDLDRFLDNVANAVGVNMTPEQERAYADRMVMTWDQVRALRDAGMDVQSHTATHRVLQTLCERELWQELVRSRHVLQDVVGAPVNAVSYPVGRQLDLPTERIVAACGYELGFSNATGFNTRWTLRPYNVKRVAMDRGVSLEFFRAMLTAPILAY